MNSRDSLLKALYENKHRFEIDDDGFIRARSDKVKANFLSLIKARHVIMFFSVVTLIMGFAG